MKKPMKISVSFARYERNLYDKAINNEDVSRYIKSLIMKDLENDTNTPRRIVNTSELNVNDLKTAPQPLTKPSKNISSFI